MRGVGKSDTWRAMPRDDRIAMIKDVWFDGASARDIAQALWNKERIQITRNAIIGYYSRHANELHTHPLQIASRKKTTRATHTPPRPLKGRPIRQIRPTTRKRANTVPSTQAEAETLAYDNERMPYAKQLVDRTGCCWPYKTPTGYLFCDAPKDESSQWCAHHRARCTRPLRENDFG